METDTKSCVFVKKLLTVSISNITYLRSMFPENAYSNRSMDGRPLKILMEKNNCKPAAVLAAACVSICVQIPPGGQGGLVRVLAALMQSSRSVVVRRMVLEVCRGCW